MDIVFIFWFFILAALAGLVWLCCSRSRAALGLVILLALAALIWAGFLSWMLRDGLGPDAVTSSGLQAWRRFASDMLFPVGVCAFIVIVAISLFWWRRGGLTKRCSEPLAAPRSDFR